MAETTTGEVCIANIGPRQRRVRLVSGAVSLALAAGLFAVLLATGAHRLWRLTLFLPLAAAAVGYFQARRRTWVALASRGLRDLDRGPEAIADSAELAAVRAQARRVYLESLVASGALTALSLLAP